MPIIKSYIIINKYLISFIFVIFEYEFNLFVILLLSIIYVKYSNKEKFFMNFKNLNIKRKLKKTPLVNFLFFY